MEFVVNAATAMTTALGHDFGVMESPGLAAAGLYDTHSASALTCLASRTRKCLT